MPKLLCQPPSHKRKNRRNPLYVMDSRVDLGSVDAKILVKTHYGNIFLVFLDIGLKTETETAYL